MWNVCPAPEAPHSSPKYSPTVQQRPSAESVPSGLSEPLEVLARTRPLGRLPHEVRHDSLRNPPSVRFATIHRGAFSLADFCYAYCRAQHDAMAVHHPRYPGQGFTFIVPHLSRGDGEPHVNRRASPVLCSFRTRRGAPESASTFKQRLMRRFEEADEGRDLLHRVLDDSLRVPVPRILKSAVVRMFERGLWGDGGSFLAGRGLVARIEVPEELVDPIAQYAGIYEGIYGGSCQERGGIALTAVDRGFRRDLCAIGTGIFRMKAPMDLFWQRFAFFLGQAAM